MTNKFTGKNLQILYVIGSLDLGGAERHLAQITPALRNAGWTPTIYCLTHRGAQYAELERQGVSVIGPPYEYKARGQLIRLLALIASCAKLLGILLLRRPSIIHFFLPLAYVIGTPLSIVAGVPIRIMSRRSLNFYQRRYPLISWLERRFHRHMNCVLGNSGAVIKDLLAEGVDVTRTKLIHNGIDLNPFGETSSAEENRPSSLVFIIVANLIQYKGHADLIEAFASISHSLPAGWKLWCVGRDDGLKEGLQLLAKTRNVADNVVFLGPQTDVPSLLKSADISILCSHEEGFSNAILEAMAAQLPVIATNVGGNPEAVVHGETGLIVPSKDPTSLAQAILYLALNPQLRKDMGRAGRRRVKSLFSIDRCAQAYSDLYDKILGYNSSSFRADK